MEGPTLVTRPATGGRHPGATMNAIMLAPRATIPTPVPAPPSAAARPDPRRGLVLATALVAALGMFLSIYNAAIVGGDYSEITKDLGGSQVDIQWVTTAYRASQGLVIPAAAWLCRRFGTRRVFLASMLLYALTSALCGVAGNLDVLVAARVLQAVPGAVTPIVCMLIFYAVVPLERMAAMLSTYVIVVVSGVGFAPLVGGILGQYATWRMIFFAVVPVALAGMVAGAWLLPATPGRPGERPDLAGLLLSGVGLASLLIAVSEGQDWGWTSYPVLILLTVGLDALALFVYIELRVARPLLNLRIFRNAPFVMAALLIDVMFTGLFLVLALVPSFLTQAQGLTPTNAGLVMVPQALAWMVATPLAVRLFGRHGTRLPAVLGTVLLGGGTLMLVRINVDLPRPELALWLSVGEFGLGLVATSILGGSIATLAPAVVPDALAIRLVFQRIASGIGVALLTALVNARRQQNFANWSALLSPDRVAGDPRIQHMREQGPDGLLPLWQQLQYHSLAQACSDVFLVSGVLTLLCVVGILIVRWGPAPGRRA
jgi:EmrB/QacA subfamily drug resistance transporter